MIAPDMATMLSFVFTDAPLSSAVAAITAQERRRRHLHAVTIDSAPRLGYLLAFATVLRAMARQRLAAPATQAEAL